MISKIRHSQDKILQKKKDSFMNNNPNLMIFEIHVDLNPLNIFY